MERLVLLSCAWVLSGCAGFRAVEVYVANVAGGAQTFDETSWADHGRHEALIAQAARQLGCAPDAVQADSPRGEAFLVEGCGGGVFVEVSAYEYQAPPPGVDRKTVATHWFVDVAHDRAAETFTNAAAADWDGVERYYGTAGANGSVEQVAAELRRIAERNRRGAADLDCPRERVALSHVAARGLTLRFAEGCGRRATYADDLLIGRVAAPEAGKLAQF